MLSYVPSWIDDCYTLLAKVNKCIEKTEEVLDTLNGKQDKLTTPQLSAVNSGITQGKVAHYDTIPVVVGNPTGSGTVNLIKLKVGNTIYLIPQGTEVEGNPTESGSVNLTKIKIGDNVYLIPEGTVVEGNPTETGSDNLTKIKIGGTVYNIPSGGGGTNLYKHEVACYNSTFTLMGTIYIISTESQAYTTLDVNIISDKVIYSYGSLDVGSSINIVLYINKVNGFNILHLSDNTIIQDNTFTVMTDIVTEI